MLFQLAKKILIALSNGNFAYKIFVKTDAPQWDVQAHANKVNVDQGLLNLLQCVHRHQLNQKNALNLALMRKLVQQGTILLNPSQDIAE